MHKLHTLTLIHILIDYEVCSEILHIWHEPQFECH